MPVMTPGAISAIEPKHIQLAQLLSPNGTVWQVTEPTPAAAKHLKKLEIKNPPPVLDLR
jgi:hypothetical protein